MIFEVFIQRHRQENSQSSDGVQLKFLGLRESPFKGIARRTLSWQWFDVRQKSEQYSTVDHQLGKKSGSVWSREQRDRYLLHDGISTENHYGVEEEFLEFEIFLGCAELEILHQWTVASYWKNTERCVNVGWPSTYIRDRKQRGAVVWQNPFPPLKHRMKSNINERSEITWSIWFQTDDQIANNKNIVSKQMHPLVVRWENRSNPLP